MGLLIYKNYARVVRCGDRTFKDLSVEAMWGAIKRNGVAEAIFLGWLQIYSVVFYRDCEQNSTYGFIISVQKAKR
jgi:hypothetical protein